VKQRHARIGRQPVDVRDQRHDWGLSIHRDDRAGIDPVSIAVDPAGKFAYVTNSGSNDVSMYSIGPIGTLTLLATIGT